MNDRQMTANRIPNPSHRRSALLVVIADPAQLTCLTPSSRTIAAEIAPQLPVVKTHVIMCLSMSLTAPEERLSTALR
jgi:hypothetical protein